MRMFASKMIQITLGTQCKAIRVSKRKTYLLVYGCLYFFMHIWRRNKQVSTFVYSFCVHRWKEEKSEIEIETKRKYLKACRNTHIHHHPLLPFSLGCSLITLLDLSACGWAHYPSTLALLLPETVPQFRSYADTSPLSVSRTGLTLLEEHNR